MSERPQSSAAERGTSTIAAELRASAPAGGGPLAVEAAEKLEGLLGDLVAAETARDQAKEQVEMLLRVVRRVHVPLADAFELLAARQPWTEETRDELARLLETFELPKALRDEQPGPPMPRIGLPQFTLYCQECGIEHCTRCHDEHRCTTCNTTVGHTTGYHCTKCKDTAKRVTEWNRDFPVTTPVTYSSVMVGGFSNPRKTTTRGEAWVTPAGQAVVTVEGVGGWVSLDHVSPLVDPAPAADQDPPECADAPGGEHHLHPLSHEEETCCYCSSVFPRSGVTL